ncbi:MAG: oligosaccharide flippase family protein [Clostridia bacterium]|nr:oligosaccharide flippase family protein [Clostridia bacterium]
MKSKYNNTVMNTAMLYLMNIAKMVFPLITLPYLTRVLSVDCYGVVAYVKVMVGYAQIIIDFGFILSAVKEIVEANNDKGKISQIIGDTVISKLMLSAVAVGGIILICSKVEILEGNMTFTCLSLCVPVLSCFLMDFLFRGIEKMHIITIIYVFMKTVSTLFTLFAVKGDGDILLIPLFDMLSSVLAVILTWIIVKHIGFSLRFTSFRNCINKIKASFGYFANSMASSAFGALNTVIMGIFMKDTQQIAFWSVCMQVVGAIQNMYTPISNGIYPYMIKTK